MSDSSHLQVSYDGPLCWLTVNRPEKHNALNRELMTELQEALQQIRHRKDARVVLVSGAGEKAFIAGADLNELSGLSTLEAYETAERGQQVFRMLELLGKPSIAVIRGWALGGGLELALACDLRIASEGARLGLPEVSLGLIPGYGGTQRLAQLIGSGPALQMILSAQPVRAAEALRLGLVNQVVPERELRDQAQALALAIAAHSPLALELARTAVKQARLLPLEQGLALERSLFAQACSSEDGREGTSAFLQKRKPEFKGQ